MLINLRIMPYETTLIDVLAKVMSLFFCHTKFNIWISFCTNKVMVGTSSKYKKEQWTVTSFLITMYPSPLAKSTVM